MKLRDLLQPIALGFENVKQNHGLQVHSHVSQQNPVAEVLPSPNLLTNEKEWTTPPQKKTTAPKRRILFKLVGNKNIFPKWW